jgi:hypothetical protein
MLLSSLVKQETSNLPKGMNYAANCQITDDEQLSQRRLSTSQISFIVNFLELVFLYLMYGQSTAYLMV